MANMTPNINLMAWRAKQQSNRTRKMWMLIMSTILLAIIALIAFHYLLLYAIQSTKSQILPLQQKLTEQQQLKDITLQNQKEITQLKSRINFINNLQTQRNQTIQLITQLSNITPAGIYIISMTQNNQQVTLVGKTVSSAQLASLMQNIDQSTLLNQAKLNEMKFNNTTPPYQNDFVITTNTTYQFPLS